MTRMEARNLKGMCDKHRDVDLISVVSCEKGAGVNKTELSFNKL